MAEKLEELAFPFVSHGGVHEHQYVSPGMTLRDYFAAAALPAFIALQEDKPDKIIAGFAYDMADAMLEARKPKDECEHKIKTGDFCQECNKEYKAASVENDLGE